MIKIRELNEKQRKSLDEVKQISGEKTDSKGAIWAIENVLNYKLAWRIEVKRYKELQEKHEKALKIIESIVELNKKLMSFGE